MALDARIGIDTRISYLRQGKVFPRQDELAERGVQREPLHALGG